MLFRLSIHVHIAKLSVDGVHLAPAYIYYAVNVDPIDNKQWMRWRHFVTTRPCDGFCHLPLSAIGMMTSGHGNDFCIHYSDVIMGTIASQIISLTTVYSTVYSDADQRKHQGSASLAFVRGIHRGPVNFPHKWPVTWEMFPFDDVIMLLTFVGRIHRSPVDSPYKGSVLHILNMISVLSLSSQMWNHPITYMIERSILCVFLTRFPLQSNFNINVQIYFFVCNNGQWYYFISLNMLWSTIRS